MTCLWMEAVVLSDVIQMVILYLGILMCLIYSIDAVGGFGQVMEWFPKTGEALAGLGDWRQKLPFTVFKR